MLSLIPWPGPTIFKISCPKDNARLVRKIIQTKWVPILEKFKVSIPLECPFHPQRDIFGPQQLAKHQHRPSQWTCGLCGKSFFEEKFLDMHFDNRHKNHVNMVDKRYFLRYRVCLIYLILSVGRRCSVPCRLLRYYAM